MTWMRREGKTVIPDSENSMDKEDNMWKKLRDLWCKYDESRKSLREC